MAQLSRTVRESDFASLAEQPHAQDLSLAATALTGDPRAVRNLTRHCWPVVVRYLRRFAISAAELDDVGQELWKSLLVRTDSGPAKLASYSGRGPLGAFVGITAQRIVIMRQRRAGTTTRAVRAAAEIDGLIVDAEMALLKERYRAHFVEAVGDALRGLDDRTRMVLRMHLLDLVSLERIAQAYKVRQSSVSRWLEDARGQIAKETRRTLRKRLQLSESDFDSIRRLVMSQLDISIAQFLKPA